MFEDINIDIYMCLVYESSITRYTLRKKSDADPALSVPYHLGIRPVLKTPFDIRTWIWHYILHGLINSRSVACISLAS